MNMVVQIAWGITGAGHFLKETLEVMDKLVENKNVTVTTFLSSAGKQVVRMYGLWNKLEQVSTGKYLQEIITETDEDPGFSHTGRFIFGLYDALVISPGSANTVAKIAYGIADTLVTNAVAHAQKAGVSVYLVPTDQQEGSVETILPYRIDRKVCKLCNPCSVVDGCSHSAVKIIDNIPKINSMLCLGCGVCLTNCQFGAVKYGEKKKLHIRAVDVQNVKRLQRMKNMTILENPQQIETIIKNL